jgi:hypothetical protein
MTTWLNPEMPARFLPREATPCSRHLTNTTSRTTAHIYWRVDNSVTYCLSKSCIVAPATTLSLLLVLWCGPIRAGIAAGCGVRKIMTLSDIAAAIAVVFSAYSLWQSSLSPAALDVFVPPVISYASPYQNSNFEAFAIPVTITNEGARTGTVLSMTLVVTDPARNVSKHFYSANFGKWTLDKFRAGEFQPFAPISIPGSSSATNTVQFYARSDETVMQIVEKAGQFQFAIMLDAPASQDVGIFGRLLSKAPQPLTFEMLLPGLNQRAFTSGAGTVELHQREWQSTSGS